MIGLYLGLGLLGVLVVALTVAATWAAPTETTGHTPADPDRHRAARHHREDTP